MVCDFKPVDCPVLVPPLCPIIIQDVGLTAFSRYLLRNQIV